jgi:hypothetical protein
VEQPITTPTPGNSLRAQQGRQEAQLRRARDTLMWTGVRNLTTQTRQNIRERLQAEIAALTNSIPRVDEEIMEIDEETTSNTSGSNGGDGVERVEGQSSALGQPDGDARHTAGEGPDDDSFDPFMRTTTRVETGTATSPEGRRRGAQAEEASISTTAARNDHGPEAGFSELIAFAPPPSSIPATNRAENSSTQSP